VPAASLDELSIEGFSNKDKTSLQIVELFLGVSCRNDDIRGSDVINNLFNKSSLVDTLDHVGHSLQ
jgi:hypothetical protein